MKPTADQIIAAVKARGNDPADRDHQQDLRDAAHEACHALDFGVKGPWTRKAIHAAARKRGRTGMAGAEILARAVERLVCEELGVEIEPVDRWSFVACMEAMKSGIAFPSMEAFSAAVLRVMRSPAAKTMAARVMALPFEAVPVKAPRRKKNLEGT